MVNITMTMMLMIMMIVVVVMLVVVVMVVVVVIRDMVANEVDVSASDYYFDDTIILVRVAPKQIIS